MSKTEKAIKFISTLKELFSDSPLSRYFWRYIILIILIPIVLPIIVNTILKNDNWIIVLFSIVAFFVISFFFVWNAVHIPRKKQLFCVYLMFLPEGDNDSIKNGICSRCKSYNQNTSYTFYCPNPICRFFYNWAITKESFFEFPFFSWYNKYISSFNGVFLHGDLNCECKNGEKRFVLFPQIYTRNANPCIDSLKSDFEQELLSFRSNKSSEDFDQIALSIVSFGEIYFDFLSNKTKSEIGASLKSLYLRHNINKDYGLSSFMPNWLKNTINAFVFDLSSKEIEMDRVSDFLSLCDFALLYSPDNLEIFLAKQYWTVKMIKDSLIPKHKIKEIALELLECSKSFTPDNKDKVVFIENKAYLLLMAGKYNDAISLYKSFSNFTLDAFNFITETVNSPSLGVYSKLAYTIKYYHSSVKEQQLNAFQYAAELSKNDDKDIANCIFKIKFRRK